MSYQATVEIGDMDTPIIVEYDIDPGQQGRTYGPPENCCEHFPASVEIISVKYLSGKPADRHWDKLTEAEVGRIEDRILEDADWDGDWDGDR